VSVEGLRRAGRNLTRAGYIAALESMHDVDLGGFYISYSPTDHTGSEFVDLTIIGRGGKFLR
jgi:branched-chain amino acid transport system substrate-binding protein